MYAVLIKQIAPKLNYYYSTTYFSFSGENSSVGGISVMGLLQKGSRLLTLGVSSYLTIVSILNQLQGASAIPRKHAIHLSILIDSNLETL